MNTSTRQSTVTRRTKETDITATLNLDGDGTADIQSGIPFLDHMLEQLARHGLMDITLKAKGDTNVDAHHTTEDCGIALGQAFKQALGDGRGIRRFGHGTAPMDDALTDAAVDCCGRVAFVWKVTLTQPKLGDTDSEVFREWFDAFAQHGGVTLHIKNRHGENTHHIVESCFKALALALREAVALDPRVKGVPSTKGVLGDG